jgi:Clr5 domain
VIAWRNQDGQSDSCQLSLASLQVARKYICILTPRSFPSRWRQHLSLSFLPKINSSKRLSASRPSGCQPEMAAITFLPSSDAMMMMQIGSAKWHTSEADWEPHRALIRRLYLEEDRPLKDVMAFMEREHGFKATSGFISPPIGVSNLTL